MQNVHIGNEIKTRLEEKGMTVAEFARRLKRTSQGVYHTFGAKSIDTALLQRISEILEFDFFSLYTTGKKTDEGTKTSNKKRVSILIEVEDIYQQKAILKAAGISIK